MISEHEVLYLSGAISSDPHYREKFADAQMVLDELGYIAINPCILPAGMAYEQYMKICFSMIDVCDTVVLLNNWEQSSGARRERNYAIAKQKNIYTIYEFIAWMISSGKMTPEIGCYTESMEVFREGMEARGDE